MNLEQRSSLKGVNALPRAGLLWGELVICLMDSKMVLFCPLQGQKGDRSVCGCENCRSTSVSRGLRICRQFPNAFKLPCRQLYLELEVSGEESKKPLDHFFYRA